MISKTLRKNIKISLRCFSTEPNLQGAYDMKLQTPTFQKHEYDRSRVPNLFSQALESDADQEAFMDRVLSEMRKMDGLEVDHAKMKSVQEAMPEGQFKLTKEAYQN